MWYFQLSSRCMEMWSNKVFHDSSLFIYHTHDDFNSADPSIMQDAYQTWTQLYGLKLSVSSRSSVDRAPCPAFRRSLGSIPVGDSDFFFVPRSCHVDQFSFHISLPSLKFTIFTSFTKAFHVWYITYKLLSIFLLKAFKAAIILYVIRLTRVDHEWMWISHWSKPGFVHFSVFALHPQFRSTAANSLCPSKPRDSILTILRLSWQRQYCNFFCRLFQ